MKYVIAFRRNDRFGTEEYDGGTTIADARKEAQFFAENLPAGIRVRICAVDKRTCGLVTKEAIDSNGLAVSASAS